jgi:hypothetical protein
MATLRQLWLEDNPLACARMYRIDALACFAHPLETLDGRAPTRSEREMAALRAQARLFWLTLLARAWTCNTRNLCVESTCRWAARPCAASAVQNEC